MWIIGGLLDDQAAEESLSNVTKSISLPKKSKITKAEIWAKRKLSYIINNFSILVVIKVFFSLELILWSLKNSLIISSF